MQDENNTIHVESEELYYADKAVREFGKTHKRPLSEEEHEELGVLLRNRARALSDALGIEVSSVAD